MNQFIIYDYLEGDIGMIDILVKFILIDVIQKNERSIHY